MKNILKVSLLVSFILFTGSCVSYESLVNYTEPPGIPDQPQLISNFQPVLIQPNDILRVRISSSDALAVQPFVMGAASEGSSGASGEYLVNSRGEVNFPTLGRVELQGLGMEEAAEKLLQLLAPYFENAPIVDVSLINFKVNVNGEVSSPGIFSIPNERVTILDALSLAGDFTVFSRRDSILIIRERDSMRTFGYIDLNSADAFKSPYFYLQQNDVIYVRPDKTKTNSVRDPASRFLPWVSVIVSLTAVTVSIIRIR